MNVDTENKKNLDNFIKKLTERILKAAVNASIELTTNTERKLKTGLGVYGGKEGSKDYKNSPVGKLPYLHSGDLRNSIGSTVVREGSKITLVVGSGVANDSIEYAKYLEGRKHDGIRPFLWYIKDFFTVRNLKVYFNHHLGRLK